MKHKFRIFRIGKWLLVAVLIALSVLNAELVSQVTAQSEEVLKDTCGRPLYDSNGPVLYTEPCSMAQDVQIASNNSRFFEAKVVFPTDTWLETVSIVDLDGDGAPEVATSSDSYAGSFEGMWILAQSQLTPTLQYTDFFSTGVSGRDPESLVTADVNGDGHMDVVVANAHGGASDRGDIQVFWGPDFTSSVSRNAGNTPYGLAAFPDGRFANTNWLSSYTSVWGWNGSELIQTRLSSPQAGWNDISIGQLYGDASPDLFVSWGQLNRVPLFSGWQGQRHGFSSRIDYPKVGFPPHWDHPNAIKLGDVNDDGRDEVFIANSGNRPNATLQMWSVNAMGTLTLTQTLPSYDCVEGLNIADVNCDGRKDVIATNAGWNAFSWWPQLPDGSFGDYVIEDHSIYFSHIGPNGDGFADMNGDGLGDYVTVSYNHGLVVALQRPCVGQIEYSPQAISKTLESGTTLNYGIMISNTGIAPLNLDAVIQEHINPWLTVAPTQTAVASGTSLSLTTVFNAIDRYPGQYVSEITLVSNDPDRPEITIPVTMTVIAADITTNPTSNGCYDVKVMEGNILTKTFIIRNEGDVDLKWSVDEWPTWFRMAGFSGIIPPDGELEIEVYFNQNKDLAVGSYTGSFLVHSNDPSEREVLIPMKLEVLESFDIYLPLLIKKYTPPQPEQKELFQIWPEKAQRNATLEEKNGAPFFEFDLGAEIRTKLPENFVLPEGGRFFVLRTGRSYLDQMNWPLIDDAGVISFADTELDFQCSGRETDPVPCSALERKLIELRREEVSAMIEAAMAEEEVWSRGYDRCGAYVRSEEAHLFWVDIP